MLLMMMTTTPKYNGQIMVHVVAALLLTFGTVATNGQSRAVSAAPVDNSQQETIVDLDTLPAYYPSGATIGTSAANAMDTVDLLDMLRPAYAPLPSRQLSRAQLQRFLRNTMIYNAQPALAAAAAAASSESNYANGIGQSDETIGQSMQPLPNALPLYRARLLRMQNPLPEMKRTARGRSMQCYFNPISCY